MNQKIGSATPKTPEAIAQEIEALIAQLRKVAFEPMAIKVTPKVDIEIRPAADDDRITVGHSDWGFTTVNYTTEGVIVDICTDAGETLSTISAYSEDLETLPN